MLLSRRLQQVTSFNKLDFNRRVATCCNKLVKLKLATCNKSAALLAVCSPLRRRSLILEPVARPSPRS